MLQEAIEALGGAVIDPDCHVEVCRIAGPVHTHATICEIVIVDPGSAAVRGYRVVLNTFQRI
jgi:hypothetical protein